MFDRALGPRLELGPSDNVPLKVVLALLPPAVSVAELAALLVTVPLPDNDPIVLLNQGNADW